MPVGPQNTLCRDCCEDFGLPFLRKHADPEFFSSLLVLFTPGPLSAEQVVGRVIDEISLNVGTYGMGGPGFFGVRLGSEWLVIAVWGAAEWMAARGRCLSDTFHKDYGRPSPWLPSDGEFEKHVIGKRVKAIVVRRSSLAILLDNGFDLTIEESPDSRPILEGAKKPRKFATNDDLRNAVFLAPTAEIWV